MVLQDSHYWASNWYSECSKTQVWQAFSQWSSVIWITIPSEALPLIPIWMTRGSGGSASSPSTCSQTLRSPCPWSRVCQSWDCLKKCRWLYVFLADRLWCCTARHGIDGNMPSTGRMFTSAECAALTESCLQSFYLEGSRLSWELSCWTLLLASKEPEYKSMWYFRRLDSWEKVFTKKKWKTSLFPTRSVASTARQWKGSLFCTVLSTWSQQRTQPSNYLAKDKIYLKIKFLTLFCVRLHICCLLQWGIWCLCKECPFVHKNISNIRLKLLEF